MFCRLCLFFLAFMSGAPIYAFAHEVQNTEIRAIFGEDDRAGMIEIWQTTPLEIAHGVTRSGSDQGATGAELIDSDVLDAIGQQWRVDAAKGPCRLTKQAHRRLHHGTQLQMRFLFTCPEGERPARMQMTWMKATPPGHFAVLNHNSGKGSPFKVIERGRPIIDFDAL